MQTTAVTQRNATVTPCRVDRPHMEKTIVVRTHGHRLAPRIDTCARGIGSHIQPLDGRTIAQVLVKAGEMIIAIVVIDGLLIPAVAAEASARCKSTWGDGANASLGYDFHEWYVLERGRKVPTKFCIRSWLTSANILPCEPYAVPINDQGLSTIKLKHQIAIQEQTVYGWSTRENPELEISFWPDIIALRITTKNSAGDIYEGNRSAFWSVLGPDFPSSDQSIPTNLCAAQAAQSESSLAQYATTVAANVFYTTAATLTTAAAAAGQIATSLITYALDDCCPSVDIGMPTNVPMIAQSQKESARSFSGHMITVGFLGIAALGAASCAVYYAIKRRLHANANKNASDTAQPPESTPLQNAQEEV